MCPNLITKYIYKYEGSEIIWTGAAVLANTKL